MEEDSFGEVGIFDEKKGFECDSIQTEIETGDVKIPQDVECDSANESNRIDEIENKGDDATPSVGMVFKSYDEAVKFYKRYAQSTGFRAIIKKSSFTNSGICRRLILGCTKGGKGRTDPCYMARETAKTNCQAIVVTKLWADGLLHIVEANLDHNHPLNPSQTLIMKKPCKKGEIIEQLQCVNSNDTGLLKFGEGDDESMYQFFAGMQSKIPGYFYSVDLDKNGKIRNLFWADARSKSAYKYYGHDVLYLDTGYLSEKYDIPLVLFVGVNHHGQSILFGSGLLSDQTVASYTWLFRVFLTCMKYCFPKAIITDHCDAIKSSVSQVFPRTKHRLCLSLIVKKLSANLSKEFLEREVIIKGFKRVVYSSLTAEDFDEGWRNWIEQNGLRDNEWFSSLYANRNLWAPVFLKDNFWAGMSDWKFGVKSTYTALSFFDVFVYPKTTLKQFLSKYETVMESKYRREAHADSESFNKNPLTVSKFYMEEQISRVYTIDMFRKFQEELKATMYCDATLIRVNGSVVTFQVKECSYIENGKRTESKNYEVYFNEGELNVQCICGLFQFNGILCRHALSVFKIQQIFEIPSKYILDRWRKDYKKFYALNHPSIEILNDNNSGDLADRFDYLSECCVQLADLGFISDHRYLVALKLLKEAEDSLLDRKSNNNNITNINNDFFMDTQPTILNFESGPSENGQSVLTSHLSGGVNYSSDSLNVKSRGQFPKKAQDSNIEMLTRSNTEQDFLSSPLVQGEMNLLQTTPSSSHPESHIVTQGGIDLMEEIAPNDLSFGTHFGVSPAHEHDVADQSSNFLQIHHDHLWAVGQGFNGSISK